MATIVSFEFQLPPSQVNLLLNHHLTCQFQRECIELRAKYTVYAEERFLRRVRLFKPKHGPLLQRYP